MSINKYKSIYISEIYHKLLIIFNFSCLNLLKKDTGLYYFIDLSEV